MGPRFFKRGEHVYDAIVLTVANSFNGATLFQAWRGYRIRGRGDG